MFENKNTISGGTKEFFKDKKKIQPKIIKYKDPARALPDGSKIIFAEDEEKIIIKYQKDFQKEMLYVFYRMNGKIAVNNREGDRKDRIRMIELGQYLLDNFDDHEMVTIYLNNN